MRVRPPFPGRLQVLLAAFQAAQCAKPHVTGRSHPFPCVDCTIRITGAGANRRISPKERYGPDAAVAVSRLAVHRFVVKRAAPSVPVSRLDLDPAAGQPIRRQPGEA